MTDALVFHRIEAMRYLWPPFPLLTFRLLRQYGCEYTEDEDDDDNCSLFSVQTSSSASSIARSSNTANYRFENNRRYQSFREDWPLPNDEANALAPAISEKWADWDVVIARARSHADT